MGEDSCPHLSLPFVIWKFVPISFKPSDSQKVARSAGMESGSGGGRKQETVPWKSGMKFLLEGAEVDGSPCCNGHFLLLTEESMAQLGLHSAEGIF